MAHDALRVAVLGASGYAGAELLRLLAVHPDAEVVSVAADASAGRSVGEVLPHLSPFAGMPIEKSDPATIAGRADAALLALPHEESARVAPLLCEAGVRVVDLSGAFRLPAAAYPRWYGFEHPAPAWVEKAVYGLPELHADRIAGTDLVANPGCYPTAALLALVPLVRAGLVEPHSALVDAKSGISGAGKAPTGRTHFSASDGSIRPYGAGGTHRHIPEMERVLGEVARAASSVTFVPHLVPTVRGIVTTCYARPAPGVAEEKLRSALAEAYAPSPFVRVLAPGDLPDSKRTAGSNAVEVTAILDRHAGMVVAIAALDNLGKGASGQAIQNLNIMHGLPETAGLDAPAVYP